MRVLRHQPCFAGRMADVLIAHGVTFADVPDNNVGDKWIPVRERLPEKEGKCFVWVKCVSWKRVHEFADILHYKCRAEGLGV